MPRFKCINEDCSLHEKEVFVEKVKYEFCTKTMKLSPNPRIYCKECDTELTEIVSEKPEGFSFNKFDSLTTSEKRLMMHKRSQEHFKKHDKGDLANYKQKIMNDNKRRAMGK